jgi:hypothetical protein
MDDKMITFLREKWYNFNGSVREFREEYVVVINVRNLTKLLKGVNYKHLPVLGKDESILHKRIDDPKLPLPMTGLYLNGGRNNHADMLVAYYVQHGSERAATMLFKKYTKPARAIIVKMMHKKNYGTTTTSSIIQDLTADCLCAVIMQVKNSYKPNEGSNFNAYFTSIVKNTCKKYLTGKTKSKDAMENLSFEDEVWDKWEHTKPTDSAFE